MTDEEVARAVTVMEVQAGLEAFFMMNPEARLYEQQMLAIAKAEPASDEPVGWARLERLFNLAKWGVS